jgi:hypothetical protein
MMVWTLLSPKERGDIFFMCEPPILGIHTLMYIAKVLLKPKDLTLLSPKERGDIFFMCEPPIMGIHTLMYIAEVLLRQKDLLQVLFLHQNPYRHLNSIVLFLWTTRDQFLS